MKRMQKLFHTIMVTLLIISSLPLNLVRAIETDGITLNYAQVPSKMERKIRNGLVLETNQQFWTGENMESRITFKANLQDAEFNGAYLALTASGTGANFVESMIPQVDFNVSEVFSRTEKVGNEQRIYFKQSTSGDAREIEIPVFSKFKDFETPDKAQIDVVLTLKRADGSVVKTAAHTATFIGRAAFADYTPYVNNKPKDEIFVTRITDQNTVDPSAARDVVFKYEPMDSVVFNSVPDRDALLATTDASGRRVYDRINLTQVLPEYAQFDATKNPNWTYDASTRTATYTFERKDYNGYGYNAASLTLTFPNVPLDKMYTITSTMEFVPKQKTAVETNVVVSKPVSYVFKGKRTEPGFPYDKVFIKDEKDSFKSGVVTATNEPTRIQKGFDWLIHVPNKRWDALTVNEFKDFNLDNRLYYTGVELVRDVNVAPYNYMTTTPIQSLTNVTVKGLMANGSEKVFGTINTGGKLDFPANEAKNIKALYFVLPNGQTIASRHDVFVKVKSAFRTTPVVNADNTQNLYANSASFNGVHADGYAVSGNDTDRFALANKKPTVKINKGLVIDYSVPFNRQRLRTDGQEAVWDITKGGIVGINDMQAINGLADNDVLTNVELIDLLPEGVDYIAATVSRVWGVPNAQITYERNYQDSGLNAVVIKYPSITVGQFNQVLNGYNIKIRTRVTSNSKPGQNVNRVLMKIDGEFLTKEQMPRDATYVDDRDLNGNGNTTEVFAEVKDYYEYTGSYELIARKYIARSHVNNWNKDGLKTGPGADFRYKLYNYNNKLAALNNYELVDLFPYVNDFTPARAATNDQYTPRQSKFANTLTGPVTIASKNAHKFDIFYTTDRLTTKVENPSTTLNWSTTVTDYSQVTGLKVKLKAGQSFTKGEELEVIVPVKAPLTAVTGQRAWNDFIISSDSSEFVPTNKVWNEIYEPSSPFKLVKEDVNGQKLAGAKFTVKSTTNAKKVYRLITNEQGIAKLVSNPKAAQVILPVGEYTVVETEAPAGYVLDATPKTITIVEDEETTLVVQNSPIVENVIVTKQWEDNENALRIRPETITVNLLKNNVVVQSVQLTAAKQWTHTFENLPSYENGQKVTYTITEDAVAGYTSAIDGYRIVNTIIPPVTVNLNATKTLNNKTLTNGQFTFELVQNNDVLERVTNNANGQITFAPLAFNAEGTYTFNIKEVNDNQVNVTYDTTVKTVVVTVTKENNRFVASVLYDNATNVPTFVNTYVEETTTTTTTTESSTTQTTESSTTTTETSTERPVETTTTTETSTERPVETTTTTETSTERPVETTTTTETSTERPVETTTTTETSTEQPVETTTEQPVETTTQQSVETTQSSTVSSSTTQQSSQPKPNPKKPLPKTGSSNIVVVMVIGLVLVGLGTVLYKRQQQ